MKKRLIWTAAIIFSIVVVFGSAVLIRTFAFRESEVKNEMTLEELQQLNIKMDYVETIDSWNEEFFSSFCQNQLDGAESCENILKVTPTGNLYINSHLILQEAKVEGVIKGNCIYSTIWLQNGLCCTLQDRGEDILLTGSSRSFMQEGCEYLIFGEEAATNAYSEKKVYTEIENMWFGCYNLNRDSDRVVDDKEPSYDPEIEFYADDKKIIGCYNKAKQELIKRYC